LQKTFLLFEKIDVLGLVSHFFHLHIQQTVNRLKLLLILGLSIICYWVSVLLQYIHFSL
jgi:hypothetical protein